MDGISTFPGASPDHMMLLSPSDSFKSYHKSKELVWFGIVCVEWMSRSCSNGAVQVTAS